MEIRAQVFQFSTNDEVNNMTFHNYVLINQGTQTLGDTYFGVWVDADIGNSTNDYVGCDVQRGLGYAYNADNNDEDARGNPGYGSAPPAIGMRFFLRLSITPPDLVYVLSFLFSTFLPYKIS